MFATGKRLCLLEFYQITVKPFSLLIAVSGPQGGPPLSVQVKFSPLALLSWAEAS